MSRKILLIEANAVTGKELLDAAAALDVAVHVATHAELYQKYPSELTDRIAGTVFTDFADADRALAELVAFGRANRIDGVITAWEFLTPLTTRVAAALGLPGHDPRFADAARNKRIMAERFEADGVPVPGTLVTESGTDALAQIEARGWRYPLVIKPVENAGSIGVTVVRSADEVPAAVRLARSWTHEFPHNIPLETTVLVQEYVDGEEFSVETVLAGGAPHHLAITRKYTTSTASRAELGHTIPAELPAPARESLLVAVDAAVRALGLRDGLAHSEVKLQPDGTAKIIEVGARPPGDHITTLLSEAFGISEARAYLQAALGDEPDIEPTRKGAAGIRFLTSPRVGKLVEITGLPPAGDGPVTESVVYHHPGAEVGGTRDNLGRIGHLIIRGDCAEDVDRTAGTALAGITIRVV